MRTELTRQRQQPVKSRGGKPPREFGLCVLAAAAGRWQTWAGPVCQGPSSLVCVEQVMEGHICTFCPGVAESDSYFRKILLIVLYRMGIKGVRKGRGVWLWQEVSGEEMRKWVKPYRIRKWLSVFSAYIFPSTWADFHCISCCRPEAYPPYKSSLWSHSRHFMSFNVFVFKRWFLGRQHLHHLGTC